MRDTFPYIVLLVGTGFVALYCAFQSAANFREHRYALGSAGVVSALLALFMLITWAYNVSLSVGAISPVRVIN